MVCNSCERSSPEGSKFCIHCGTPAVAPAVEDAHAVANPEPATDPVPVETPEPVGELVTVGPAPAPAPVSREHPPPVVAPPAPPPLAAPAPPPASALPIPPPPPPPIPAPSPPPIAGVAPPPPPEAPDALAPAEPESPVGIVDPCELGPAMARLSTNAQRVGREAAAILSALLRDDEHVDALVQGRYQNNAGLAVLTNGRILLVNDHEWRPDVREVPIVADLVVQGWQDDRTAALVFVTEGVSVTIEMIMDRPLAQEMAHLIRARVADLAG
jgi:hypothetical protein